MKTFYFDKKQQDKILLKISKKNRSWKWRQFFINFLRGCALLIFISVFIFLIVERTSPTGWIVFLFIAAVPVTIFWLSSDLLLESTLYKLSFPYSSYRNGTLTIRDTELEYQFWCIGKDDIDRCKRRNYIYKENQSYVFTITKERIKNLKFANDICTIEGDGILTHSDGSFLQTKEFINTFSFDLSFKNKYKVRIMLLDWFGQKEAVNVRPSDKG